MRGLNMSAEQVRRYWNLRSPGELFRETDPFLEEWISYWWAEKSKAGKISKDVSSFAAVHNQTLVKLKIPIPCLYRHQYFLHDGLTAQKPKILTRNNLCMNQNINITCMWSHTRLTNACIANFCIPRQTAVSASEGTCPVIRMGENNRTTNTGHNLEKDSPQRMLYGDHSCLVQESPWRGKHLVGWTFYFIQALLLAV